MKLFGISRVHGGFNDIDIVDDNTIAIFDNNVTLGWGESLNNNNLYFYNFETGPAKKNMKNYSLIII